MSSTQDLLPHLDLGNTFGALFIRVTFAAVLVNSSFTMLSKCFCCPNVFHGTVSLAWPMFKLWSTFQTHGGTGMTFHKLAVSTCCIQVLVSSVVDTTPGHLALVGILWTVIVEHVESHNLPWYLTRILDALHLALIIHCVYYYLVINYANISVLTEIVWSFKVSPSFDHYFHTDGLVQLQIVIDVSRIS